MKYFTLILLGILGTTNLMAQKETYDLVSFKAPLNWTKEVKETSMAFTILKNSNWCRIIIVKSTASNGNIELDFENEWQNLVVKNYKPTEAPQVNEVTETNGWKIKAGISKFSFNGSEAIAMLTTLSGFNRCFSIVSTTNSGEYLKDIEAFLSSVEMKEPEHSPLANDSATSIIGTWGKQASMHEDYRDPYSHNNAGYRQDQYTFYENGTYSFVSKTFRMSFDKLLFVKENGTYQFSGDKLTINPQKSVIEAWSKDSVISNGRKAGTDKFGKRLSTQKRPLEKVTYQVSQHYFSGIDQWNLIFQAGSVTQRDGAFSNSGLFTKAWLYSRISDRNPVIELPPGQARVERP